MVTSFSDAINDYGLPAATLTDNGSVYTSRFTGGKNAFEYLLAVVGVTQKNGHPGHPQTQGKIERFHQTLKRWLARQPPAATLTDLQHQLDLFRELYNTQRPHRELGRRTPATAYAARPKATAPGHGNPEHYRLRYDTVDAHGKISFRRGGRMHHLGIGARHTRQHVLAIADDTTVTVIQANTGEVLSTHHIDPAASYWRNTQRAPGRWPEAP